MIMLNLSMSCNYRLYFACFRCQNWNLSNKILTILHWLLATIWMSKNLVKSHATLNLHTLIWGEKYIFFDTLGFSAQGLFLGLGSWVVHGGAQGTICGTGDEIWVGYMQCKHPPTPKVKLSLTDLFITQSHRYTCNILGNV